ncbi:permease [Desulfospira joergensenii]|uniref:permease n=1 Tax=Desulfospira joergensenii TaxID=53329 RepID=UPI0003B74BF8|nr:permease [Desulfospira joergensenii]
MTTELYKILDFMIKAFAHIWPYLVITIPIAVAVNMSGASRYIKRAFDSGPVTAVLLATLVGAFSPFCSCGVIPVIAALLIGGVPLPPVMAFWIASPSMDPEVFFLSVGTIGWNLAVWRLAGTLVMSLSAGFITQALMQTGWIGMDILRRKTGSKGLEQTSTLKQWGSTVRSGLRNLSAFRYRKGIPVQASACCAGEAGGSVQIQAHVPSVKTGFHKSGDSGDLSSSCGCPEEESFRKRLGRESMDATLMVIRFMALAFFLEALIVLYVPEEFITQIMGKENSWAIVTAAVVGIPVYTSNLSALPMVNGLLAQGMSPAAALSFLIAGPVTTLPAMAAVWTLVKHRIFILYLSFSLAGAILLGYLNLYFG